MAVKAGDSGDDMMAEINITPFTDVLLVLLIIFMIAATAVIQNGFNINLPKAAQNIEEVKNANIVISITKEGTVYVGERALTDSELEPYLKRLQKAKNTDKVIIMADGSVRYDKVIAVMDHAKAADLTSIALATQHEENRSP